MINRLRGLFGRQSAEMTQLQNQLRRSAGELIRLRYDAVQTTDLNRRHWASADQLAPNDSHSPEVRRMARARCRAEAQNNGYLTGMLSRFATAVVGTGPQVLIDAGDDADDAAVSAVERAFSEHCDAIGLPGKLRQFHRGLGTDGDQFGVFSTNPVLPIVQLDWRLYETDQFAESAYAGLLTPGHVDGCRIDAWGNVTEWHLLDRHPGELVAGWPNNGQWIQSRFVTHWPNAPRPGQIRGVGYVLPALELFAILRRYTLATLTAAETAASIAAILETQMPASGTARQLDLLESFPIVRGMAIAAPDGWRASQMKAEHPTSTFDVFERCILKQIGSTIDMPYILAVMDSSESTYSAARGDRLQFGDRIKIDREALERVVLDRLFRAWLDEAALVPGLIPDGLPLRSTWNWTWSWPGQSLIDPLKEATAELIQLQARTKTFAEVCGARGQDWRRVFRQLAKEQRYAREVGLGDLFANSGQVAASALGHMSAIQQEETAKAK